MIVQSESVIMMVHAESVMVKTRPEFGMMRIRRFGVWANADGI